jgi:pilus assembly protein CpaB
MSTRTILLIVMLLGGGSLAWMAFQGRDAGPSTEAAAPPAVTKIFVSTQPLQAGTLLKDADVREQDVPTDSIKDDVFKADDNNRAEIRGAMVRRYLEAGQAILRPDILRPRDRGFLAAVLAPGTRAVSIAVDATTGASGLISPGDIVDIILAQEFPRGETPVGRRVVAETVLSTVRVIAVDQQIAQGAPTAGMLGGAAPNRVASTVSLQVTPEQAAKLVVAERLGRLTLIVRSIDGDPSSGPQIASNGALNEIVRASGKPDGQASVFGSDVSSALSQDEPVANPRVRLIQGDAVNDVVFR